MSVVDSPHYAQPECLAEAGTTWNELGGQGASAFEPALRQVRAIILAAGMGRRLGSAYGKAPKCLLEFGGKSLLRRSIEALRQCGVAEIAVAVGYEAHGIERELAAIGTDKGVEIQYNPHYEQGSVVTLWNLREQLGRGGDVLLMDADMLFDHRLIERLLDSRHRNCVLVDRGLEGDEEPVKLCIRDGRVVQLGKQIDLAQRYDCCGEMAGLVRLSAEGAGLLASLAHHYVQSGRTAPDYEELLRDMVQDAPGYLGFEECTGLPWIEIDFPEDVERARNEVLPKLLDIEPAARVAYRPE